MSHVLIQSNCNEAVLSNQVGQAMKKAADNKNQRSNQTSSSFLWFAAFIGSLLICITTLTSSPVHAASATLHVSAQVLSWLDVSATPHISSYRVEAEDIKRGFIDLPNSLSIQLTTNMRSNVDLNLTSFGPERVLVSNGGNSGSDILTIPAIASSLPVTRNVDLRVILPQGIEQGDYPLQLNVSAVNI